LWCNLRHSHATWGALTARLTLNYQSGRRCTRTRNNFERPQRPDRPGPRSYAPSTRIGPSSTIPTRARNTSGWPENSPASRAQLCWDIDCPSPTFRTLYFGITSRSRLVGEGEPSPLWDAAFSRHRVERPQKDVAPRHRSDRPPHPPPPRGSLSNQKHPVFPPRGSVSEPGKPDSKSPLDSPGQPGGPRAGSTLPLTTPRRRAFKVGVVILYLRLRLSPTKGGSLVPEGVAGLLVYSP